MCGIAGAVGIDAYESLGAVEAMCNQMLSRGPDDGGIEILSADQLGVVFGGRRLAIIDPSDGGHQPMTSASGVTIVFNGMIYNFRELRAQLEARGHQFRSGCDTEVVLQAYERWGDACVSELRGMFAFAIWDDPRQRLLLARDRLGIKPLYYARLGRAVLFASQVKSLLASGLIARRLSREAVESFLCWGAVSEPLTAIESVSALPAAHIAVIEEGEFTTRRYWSLPVETRTTDLETAAAELRDMLSEAVRMHLVADAPLGVFLSGGLDSSAIAGIAALQDADLRTVSVAFEEASFNEAPFARVVARHLGSRHYELTLRARDVLGSLDDSFEAMDQPSFDGLNTFAVARAASEAGLKVALSGLGGDELFNGYGYLQRVQRLALLRRVPAPLARAAGTALLRQNDKLAAWIDGDLASDHPYDVLRRVFVPQDVARFLGRGQASSAPGPAPLMNGRDLLNYVAVSDLENYTKNVLLRDTDCMSMANSLEVRVPFLDHEIVEWAVTLPSSISGGFKEVLAHATREVVPAQIRRRRKQGFALATPLWLRGELREEVASVLREPPAAVAEILEPARMYEVWEEFDRHGGRWPRVWALYSLCRWSSTVTRERVAVQA